VCSTSFGWAVVPEVKYSSSGSVARVMPSGVNLADSSAASAYGSQPSGVAPLSGPGPTAIAVQRPPRPSNLAARLASVTTCRTSPRVIRSARSAVPNSVLAGMITTPSFIAARMTSHSGAMLPSIRSRRSPRRAPSSLSQLATWLDRLAKAP
jgi:hypothetical protein